MQLCIRHGCMQHACLRSFKHVAANQCGPPTLSKLHTADTSNSRSIGINPVYPRSPVIGTIRAAAAGRRAVTAATGTDKDSAAAAAADSCTDNQQQQQQRQQQQFSAHHIEHPNHTAGVRHEDENADASGCDEDDDEAEGSEDGSGSDSDDNTDARQQLLSQLKGMMPTEQQQAVLASQISAQVYDSAVEQLGARMLNSGLKGCIALGLGWLLHIDVLNTFRWNAPDLQQGLLWALPAAAMAAVFAALPLPQQQQQAATEAAAGSSRGTGSNKDDDLRSASAYEEAKKKARNFMVASSIPLEFEISLQPNSEPDSIAAKGPVTDFTPDAFVRALSLLQEGVNRPWLLDMATPASRVITLVDEQLRRVSNEVLLRGFVATALAAGITNTWATAGTSQASPFFYARLFGLITPQTSLAVAAGLLLLGRIPYLLLSSRPLSLYTRLSCLDVQLVGQLTEDDWLVKVVPAAAAAAASVGDSSRSGSNDSSGEQKVGKEAVFGRLKKQQQQQQQEEQLDDGGGGAAEGSSSSSSLLDQLMQPGSSSSSSSSSSSKVVIPEVPVITQQQLDNQFEQLRVKVALFCAGSSSSSRDAVISSDQEHEGADLAAQILDLVELSAAVKAAAAVKATASSSRMAKAGLANAKFASALNAVMARMNRSRQQHYFIIRLEEVDDEDDSDDDEDDSSDSGSESDDVVEVTDPARSVSPNAKAAAAHAAALMNAKDSGACNQGTQERLAQAFHEVSVEDLAKMKEDDRLAVLGTMLQEVMRTSSSYAAVMAQGWRAAAAVPTAEDQITWCLLCIYTLLIELAPAGAFVATGGNVAASLVASCGYNVLATIVNDAASKHEREKLHKRLGPDWLLRLLPLQGRSG